MMLITDIKPGDVLYCNTGFYNDAFLLIEILIIKWGTADVYSFKYKNYYDHIYISDQLYISDQFMKLTPLLAQQCKKYKNV